MHLSTSTSTSTSVVSLSLLFENSETDSQYKETADIEPQIKDTSWNTPLFQKKLHQYGVLKLTGSRGDHVGQGQYGRVYNFQPNPDAGSGNTKNRLWVFKEEHPLDKNNYEEHLMLSGCYPLDKNGWQKSSVRSILVSLIARDMGGGENFVETHFGLCEGKTGVVMEKVQGKTCHDWLLNDICAENPEANGLEVTDIQFLKENLSKPNVYSDRKTASEIHRIFEIVVNTRGLKDDWNKIKFLDFIVGQVDHAKLKNIMIRKIDNKIYQLVAIDNDFSFPVQNPRQCINPPEYMKEIIVPNDLDKKISQTVQNFMPESSKAFNNRFNNARERHIILYNTPYSGGSSYSGSTRSTPATHRKFNSRLELREASVFGPITESPSGDLRSRKCCCIQ